jgi:hypothetical protein
VSWLNTSVHSGFARSPSEAMFPRLFPDAGWWCPSLNPAMGGTRLWDLSRGQNWGTLTGMANDDWVVNGGKGALDFDGTNDYVAFAKNPIDATLQTNYTITAWIRKSSGNNGSILSQYTSVTNHRLIRIFAYGATEFAYYASTSAGGFQRVAYSSVPTLGQLHFLSVVVSGPLSGPTCRLGLNGSEQSFSLSALSSTPDTSVPVYLSCTNLSGTPAEFARFAAYDDLRIYNRALTAGEVRQLYQIGRGNMPLRRRRRYTEQAGGNRRRRVLLGEC